MDPPAAERATKVARCHPRTYPHDRDRRNPFNLPAPRETTHSSAGLSVLTIGRVTGGHEPRRVPSAGQGMSHHFVLRLGREPLPECEVWIGHDVALGLPRDAGGAHQGGSCPRPAGRIIGVSSRRLHKPRHAEAEPSPPSEGAKAGRGTAYQRDPKSKNVRGKRALLLRRTAHGLRRLRPSAHQRGSVRGPARRHTGPVRR